MSKECASQCFYCFPGCMEKSGGRTEADDCYWGDVTSLNWDKYTRFTLGSLYCLLFHIYTSSSEEKASHQNSHCLYITLTMQHINQKPSYQKTTKICNFLPNICMSLLSSYPYCRALASFCYFLELACLSVEEYLYMRGSSRAY